MRPLPGPVRLRIPGEARFMRHARLIAGGVATACELSQDEVDDFRIVVDEVCAALIETGPRAVIDLTFGMDGPALALEGTMPAPAEVVADIDRLSISRQILDMLTQAYHFARDGDLLRFRVSTVFQVGPATT